MEIHKINKNYQTIEKFLKTLENFNIKSKNDFLDDEKEYLAVSMALFTILNSCIEVGESLISLKKLEFPTSYRRIFEILESNKLISKKLSKELSDFIRIRNMIAHQYDDVDFGEIYNLYQKRDIFNRFIEETKNHFN